MKPNMDTMALATRFDEIAEEIEERFIAPEKVEDALATVISFLNEQIGRSMDGTDALRAKEGPQ